MRLIPFEELPAEIKNDSVKKYYDSLKKKQLQLSFKRIFDISASIILCVILSPIIVILAIWIKLDSKGPIFYRQERITQYGKKFKIFKFRTMVIDADKNGSLVTTQNDTRITKVGNKIRKCRLDEIPQLFNVLKGEMSFVGTRPEVKRYVEKYTDEMKATLLLPAGITSLASIKFKNEDEIISNYLKDKYNIDEIYIKKILPEKMKWNIEYLSSFNFGKDFWICLRTVI
ncbi:sugar transferase [Merdibacter massiliensis]|uniref:sugar transferase n=1 Tax=Merdibacter massiliensis TaxID=1871030 RepID=UPI00096A8C84|nr:sugar transferase [Merdibacter massiliensis]